MTQKTPIDILLVEENEDAAVQAYALLHDQFPRCPVFIAHSAFRGLDFLTGTGPYAHRKNKSLPGLAVIARQLPERDGLWLLEQISLAPDLKQVPVIMMHHDATSIRPEEDFGQTDIVKPLTVQKLGQALEDLGIEEALRPFNDRVQKLFRGNQRY